MFACNRPLQGAILKFLTASNVVGAVLRKGKLLLFFLWILDTFET